MWGSYLHSKPWKATKKEIISNISLRMHGTCCEWTMAQRMRLCCCEGSRAWSMASQGVCRADFLGWPRHTLVLLLYWSSWWNSGQALNDLGVMAASMQTGPHSQAALASSSVWAETFRAWGKLSLETGWGHRSTLSQLRKPQSKSKARKMTISPDQEIQQLDSLPRKLTGWGPYLQLSTQPLHQIQMLCDLGKRELTKTYIVPSLWMLEEPGLVKLYRAAAPMWEHPGPKRCAIRAHCPLVSKAWCEM